MEKELTNLSKSLGLKKIGPLKFKEDDDLYKKFQKLIKYIYKNGEWEQKDNSTAVKKMFEYRFGKEGSLEKLSLDDTSIPQYKQTEDFSGEVYRYNWKNVLGNPMATYFFVDPQNHFGSKHGKRFRPLDYLGRQKRTSSQYIYDKEAVMLNQDRLVGFDRFEKALLEEYTKKQGNYLFSEKTLRNYLSLLIDPAMAGKKEVWRFKETNHSYGELVEFIDGYISSVYEVVVQHEYEKNLESQFRADPSTTKANINEETQKVMDNTELKEYFKFVELDNDVDLKLFGDFEREMHRVQEVLPKINDTKPDLRLRKLGNYKAAGLYFPFNKTIALDFRSDSTENRDEYKPSEPGIRSFIHEYGHYLDYNLVNSDGMTTSLSLEQEFRPIIEKYVEQLKENGIYSQSHGKTANYYAVPTEVFARAFEVYAYEKGLRSPLMKSEDYGTEPQYVSFTPEIREEITKYFDEKLPEFGGKIRELAEKERIEKQEIDQSQDKVEDTKKEGREYTPSLQSETEGSGPPDQENLIHEFDRPSLLKFNMNLGEKPRQITGFHVATQDELEMLNNKVGDLVSTAKFYKENMSQGNVVYVFKQGNNIKALRVKYGEENFSHLTGIKFDRKSAKGMLEDLVNENTEQNAILVKNDGTTFQKLDVIQKLPEVIDASVISLNDLEHIQQAQKLRFSDALKTKDNSLLLALKDFEPEIYRPYSLINLSDVKAQYNDYLRVPENTVLAVLSETRNDLGGLSIGTLSINHEYFKDMSSAMGIIDVMNKRISEEIARSESTEQERPETKTQESDTEPQEQNEDLSVQRDLEADQVNEAQEPEDKVANDPKQENVSVPDDRKLTAKQIDEAKARDILAVAQDLGIELVSDKGNYYWEAEPSFMIDTRSKTFSWKDKDIHRGDAVGLVENVKGITFAEAVRYLNAAEIASFDRNKIKYRLNNGQVTSNETQEVPPEKKTDTKKKPTRNLPKRVTKEQIAAARDRNILEVAQELGMSLQQKGQTYTWTEHDSLVIFPGTNTYSWFSKGENGKNSLDLVQSIKGMDFKTAVMYLNSAELSEFDESKVNLEPQKPFKYLLKDSNDVSKLKEYFVNERKINGQTVNDFLRSGVIAQANRIYQNQFEPVVVFKHKEASGKLVGASLQGIKEDRQRYPERGRLKEIITNSKRNWGVTYNSGLKADQNSFKMIFFEAPIDMMSYYELHKDKLEGVRLVAMNGLKDNTMGRHIAESFGFAGEPSLKDLNDRFKENGLTRSDVAKRFKAQNVSLKIAVDNDDKGREFIDRLNKKYPLIPFEADLPPLLKGREKTDWNDYLKATKLDPDLVLERSRVETKKEPDQSQIPLEKKEESKTIKEDTKKVVPQAQVEPSKEDKKEFDIETASAKELSNFAVKKIREITQDPQMLDEYMTMLGKFPEYSPRNVALIYTQAKEAQMVGTFKEWQARHDTFKLTKDDILYDEEVATRVQESGREYEQKLSIKSGERGKINLFKVKQEWKLPRTDEAGNVLKFENGNIKYKQYHPSKLTELEKKLLEDKKIEPKLLPARDKNGAPIFMKYKVFDISQTNLKQEAYQKVVGKHQYDYEAEKSKLYKISYALKAYAKENNIDYKIDKLKVDGLDPNVKGKYHDDAKHGPKVRMNKNLEFADSLGTAIRLLSHGVINNIQNTEKEATKSQRGLEAEIMGHAVAAHFGLKTEDRWLKPMTERLQELSDKELSKSLNQVAVESHKFINSIAKYSDTPKRQRDRSMKKKYNHTQTIGRNI
ncbi:PBECR4 domain-containing protein [Ligilactobacillus murinus]|uniref:Toprim domain-containing protein n=1 Tax=Ligilactobacillus murinus TaxID=1622 RepID=A0AAE6WGY8_9LACO|nr:PBECR4 domain-containing protein [Ligilactobacillus murinus]NEF81822.1 toprim domain-containing protein [Ligilactobacillus murinus]NEF83949.1 toprim domain-containing protein [Ligilactobacillus murinus]NEF86466.1 toprim domain-containing protein [Ligilactobacillus murinus]NEF88660.1 toprim domain-containing protein [Ligilactobacillus murinus]NEF90927.1 toprim domain-containing protein [Ligilactobacillus murinus]